MVDHQYGIGYRIEPFRIDSGRVIAIVVAITPDSALHRPFIVRIIAVTIGQNSKGQRLPRNNMFRRRFYRYGTP